jgi:integrase
MIMVQRLTGMRPGEVCAMKLNAFERTRDVWEYRPEHHKTAHHGKDRVILIGPKGRAILEAFIAESGLIDPAGPLFSPRRAREERYAAMRRKTKVQNARWRSGRHLPYPDVWIPL